MEGKKNVNIVLIILLIIVLCAVGGFGYMWYKGKNVSCPKCEDKVLDDKKEETVENKVSVVDATNTVPSYFGSESANKIKIIIPKIIGGKDNSEVINKKILDDVISRIILPIEAGCNTDENPKGCETGDVVDINVKYKSLVKNDIVSILVIVELNPWNASGDGTFKYNYFYDVKNDKIITATEALEKDGYTDERYLKEITECYDEDHNEIKCTLDHIKKEINALNTCDYVDIDNNSLKVHYERFCN